MLQRAVGPQAARASLLFGMRFDAEAAVRYGLALEIADDPVAAARALAAGPAAAPREVVIATRAPCARPPTPVSSTSTSTDRGGHRTGTPGRLDHLTGVRQRLAAAQRK